MDHPITRYPRNRIEAIQIIKILDSELIDAGKSKDKRERSKRLLGILQYLDTLVVYFDKTNREDIHIAEAQDAFVQWIKRRKIPFKLQRLE